MNHNLEPYKDKFQPGSDTVSILENVKPVDKSLTPATVLQVL